ncbi:hypothetical protein CA267_006130 [Alteromonas pelagimontana]|uniref:Uncharacterized protein n=1 Tax=Alteromonas pelagimontana TaxID=1858656 RepID=A0A6M4MB09_9ALTE|nr:hypothetical protein [Alteromonas pelagimontana]QJR80381.1 hypothetical protein CA267_006130 [Alteromonas pelagimontana]
MDDDLVILQGKLGEISDKLESFALEQFSVDQLKGDFQQLIELLDTVRNKLSSS